jgi:hypothetical protein
LDTVGYVVAMARAGIPGVRGGGLGGGGHDLGLC